MTEAGPSLSAADLHGPLLASPVPIILVDAKARVIDANEAAAALVGAASPEETIGSELWRFIPSEDRSRSRRLLKDILDGITDGYIRQARLLRLDRGVVPISTWARRIDSPEGPLVLVSVSPQGASDPTTWRLQQPALRGPLTVLTTDHDWRIAEVSSDAEQLLGAGYDELVGTPVLGMLHPLDAGGAVMALARVEHDREAISTSFRLRAGNEWRELLVTISTLCRHTPPRLVLVLSAPVVPGHAQRGESGEEAIGRVMAEATNCLLMPELASMTLQPDVAVHDLSGRQIEIVARLMRGQSVADIAAAMFLSQGTIRNHLTAIYKKFGVRSHAALLAALYAQGGSEG